MSYIFRIVGDKGDEKGQSGQTHCRKKKKQFRISILKVSDILNYELNY